MKMGKIQETAEKLYDKYRDYMDFYEKHSVVAKTRGVKTEDFYVLGKQLENFEQWKSFVETNGGQSDLGVLPNIALDVISAAHTQSVIPLFASVQPIDEVQGTIWYRNIVAKTNRGNLQNGEVTVDAKSGRLHIPSQYAGSEIKNEDTGAKGDGKTKEFTFKVKYAPVLKRTIVVTVEGSNVKGLDDGDGNIIGLGIAKGSVNYETGAVSVTFTDAPADGATIFISYESDFEGMNEIPTVQTDYVSKIVKARSFALRSEIGLFKSYQLSKRFGTDPDEIIAKDLVQELNAETSNAAVMTAYLSAQGNIVWKKTPPQGVSYTEHKLTFFDALAEAEAQILGQAGRFNGGTVYLAGQSAAAVIRTMPGFRPAEIQNAVLGTHYFGDLDGKPVIRTMGIPANTIVVISKGSGFFDAPVVFAPYLPLYVTNMMSGMDHNPLKAQKAVAMQAAIDAPVSTLMTKITIEG